MTRFEARLRDVVARIPIESIGLYCEGNIVIWRDCIGGESGTVLKTSSAVHSAKMAIRCVRQLRREYASWNWPHQLESELEVRSLSGQEKRNRQETRKRKAVAA